MRTLVRRLFGDERGTSFESIALSVAILAVTFVASADMLDYVTKKHAGPISATLREVANAVVPNGSAQGIDFTPTASIRTMSERTILDPCTGQKK